MPIYEYKCKECGYAFEKMQPITADSTTDCEKCGAEANRQISQSGFILKGSGFYLTDYVRNQDNQAGKTGSGEISGSSESGSNDTGGKNAQANTANESGATKSESSAPAEKSTPKASSAKTDA